MNKFKALFGQPLISSSAKIVPLKESSPDSERKAKPPEITALKKIDSPVPILNKKPEKSKTIGPNRQAAKKNSMPLRISSRPAPMAFDFEQYDDVVDTQLMKKRQEAKSENKPISPESPASPASPNGRRHTWSVPENRNARFKAEFIRIPINTDSRHSFCVKPKVEALAPPPVVVSKVISQSEITDSSDSSSNVTDSIRKDLGENGMEFLDDFKKGAGEKSGFEPSDFFASHDRLKVDNEENKEEKEENEEEVLPNIDDFVVSRTRPRHLSDSPVKIRDFMTEEERERQREIFLKVSLQQANDLRKAQNEKINENLSAVASSNSSDSDVDSLIENNPFEDEKTYQIKKKATFRRMQTRLREDERYSKLRYILFPDDTWRKFWDIVIVIALLYTALVMPIRIAFLTDDGGDDDTGSKLWPIVEYLIDSIFLGDIILTFFSAYFDRDDSLVVNRKKIAWHYLTGWFLLDLVSILPFQLFMSADQTNGSQRLNNLIRVARLPRLYRLVKIVKLARMVKIIRNRGQFLKYMNTTLKLGPAYERLLVSVIGIFLFCHIASCIWYMLVGLSDPDTGWLGTYMITYLPAFDQYIACFYLVVQTVTTVGYGDMPPQNPGERLLTVFLMIFGVLCYSIFIGFLSSLINDTEIMNQIYTHKLNTLHRLTKQYALPVFFQKKLKTAIKFQNKQTMDSKHFIGDLPTGLAVDLACIMHRDIVESIPFLQNRPKGFIASLCPTLKPITVHKNDPVFSEGDPADEIFFIKSGTIGLVLPKYKNECFLKVREGYFFGETDLLFYGEIRKYTAIALKDCELYVLNKKDFKHVFLSEHRDIGAALYDNAYMRKQRTRKAFKEAVEICKGFQQNQKHRKIRLSIITKANPLDFEPESSESEKGLGIVEEEDEEEDEHPKEKKPDGCGVPVSETKPLNPLLNLKVALALTRGLNGQRQSVMGAIGSPAKRQSVMAALGSPAKSEGETKFAGLNKARRSIFGSLLPPAREENNFADLNKKLDSLEAKMAKLAALGESMRARTSRDSMTMRDSVGSPGLPKTERNKSLLSRVLALTPSNQPRALPTDLKVPMDLSVGGVSPTNSDTSWGGLRSPNALKRQLIKKDGAPFQSSIPPIKRLSSPQNSQFDMESDRITPTPTGDLLMNKGAFLEFRGANESLTVRGDSFKDSLNLDQSSREVEAETKEAKENKEEEKSSQEEKPEKVEKVEKVGRAERKSAFRDQLRIGLKKITEREEDDAKNEKAKAHNFLFIQERRGSYKNPDKLDRKATMGETKGSNQNVEVEEF